VRLPRPGAFAIVVLAGAVLAARPAAADDAGDEAAFAAATRKLGAGDLAGARADLEALARTSPDGRWADDALAEAAAIAERQGDLAGARALWRRLIDGYPDGNPARRAGPRLAALETAGGADGAFDQVAATHKRLEREATAEDPTPALIELGTVLDRHPDYPRWFAAALWLGESWARIGERGRAMRWIERAQAAARDPAERFRAGLARADLLTAQRDFDDAERAYRSLVPPDRPTALAVEDGLRDLAWARTRWRIGVAAQVLLPVCALLAVIALRRRAGSWRGAARALWPPPLEVPYLVPVALVMVVLAESGNLLAARATEIILAGAIAITWLGGAALTAARRRGPITVGALLVHVTVVTLAVASLCYVATADLLDLLIETWRRGHEGH